MKNFSFSSLFACFVVTSSLSAQVVLTGASYTQDFNNSVSFPTAVSGLHTWSDNSSLPGWYALQNGTPATQYRATTSNGFNPNSDNINLLALRGGGSDNDGALGTLSSASNQSIFGFCVLNQTGGTVTSFNISYTGEQWSWNQGGANTLVFEYSLDATSLSTGTWTSVSSLSFTALHSNNTSNVGIVGNLPENQSSLSGTIGELSLDVGQTVWFRWVDTISGGFTNAAATRTQALGVDNLTLTAVPEPSLAMTLAVLGVGLIFARHRKLAFLKDGAVHRM